MSAALFALALFAPSTGLPPLPEGCPCDRNDWLCRDRHPPCSGRPAPTPASDPTSTPDTGSDTAPEPDAAPSPDTAPAPEPSRSRVSATPSRRLDPPAKADPLPEPWTRVGLRVAPAIGISGCTGPLCAPIPAGGSGRIELGLRHGRVEGLLGASVGGAQIDIDDFDDSQTDVATPPESKGYVRYYGVDVGIALYPLRAGRFDPFALVALGYASTVTFARNDELDAEVETRLRRGAVRLGTGWPFFVAPHVATGPRVDVTLPFAGEFCERLTVGDESTDDEDCRAVRRLQRGLSTFEKRLLRRDLPKVWSMTWEVRFMF